jgi:hypothetical protein
MRHATSASLLLDSDTSVLLTAIRARHSPLSWFAGDWPLQNHFYRPMATLAFEWDNHFYGSNAAGYGWTNDILCILCVFLLLWFVRELTDRPVFAGAAAVLFASWHCNGFGMLEPLLGIASLAILAVGVWRHRGKVGAYLPVVFAIPFFTAEMMGKVTLTNRMIDWLPGRTASVMTVFALISMAAYTRYERVSAPRAPDPPITPLTPPATRNTVLRDVQRHRSPEWVWLVVSVLALALALASYEQAVMVAPALSGVAFSLWLQGYRPRWGWQALFWGVLIGYVVLRHRIVPSAPSQYQRQQFRSGPGVYLSLCDYILPVAGGIPALLHSWDPDLGFMVIASTAVYGFFVSLAQQAGAILTIRKRWVLAFTGWALSWGTFFPMAWLKQFDHYDYWPMAMRSIFVVAFGWAIWDCAIIAFRPPARLAPPRPAPAPGSLPHP